MCMIWIITGTPTHYITTVGSGVVACTEQEYTSVVATASSMVFITAGHAGGEETAKGNATSDHVVDID